MPPIRKVLIITAALGLVGGLALSWAAGSAMVRSQSSLVPEAEAPARDLQIPNGEGLMLAATYWPGPSPGSPAILLMHGSGASRAATAPTAAWLASLGYAALTIDFRGHGESDAGERSYGLLEATDARAAFQWLKRQQRGAPVAIIGNSLGGAAALLGPSGPLPAEALVLQAVYPDLRHAIRNRIAERLGGAAAWLLEPLLSFQSVPRLGVMPSALSPIRALRTYRGPVFVIGGEDDRATPPDETRALFATAPGPKRLWIVPGRTHAAVGEMRDDVYRHRIRTFLQETIGPP